MFFGEMSNNKDIELQEISIPFESSGILREKEKQYLMYKSQNNMPILMFRSWDCLSAIFVV
jgi:hypothetical protein